MDKPEKTTESTKKTDTAKTKTENKPSTKTSSKPSQDTTREAAKETSTKSSSEALNKAKATTSHFFKELWVFLLHPTETISRESAQFDQPKKAFTFAGIIIGIMTFVRLLSEIIGKVFVTKTTYSLSGGSSSSTEIKWDNLSKVDWGGTIFGFFVGVAVVVAIVAAVYFVASRIIKKEFSFQKSVSIVCAALIPHIIGNMILGPIIMGIWAPLGIIIMCAGTIYTELILLFGMSDSMNLEKDQRIIVNFLCILALVAIIVLLAMVVLQSLLGELGIDMNLLKSLNF